MSKKIGRPKGSLSFTQIRLGDLVANLPSNAIVPISRVWLEKMGLSIAPATPTPIVPAPPSEVSTPVEFTIEP